MLDSQCQLINPREGVALLTVRLVGCMFVGDCLDGHKSSDLYLAGIIVHACLGVGVDVSLLRRV